MAIKGLSDSFYAPYKPTEADPDKYDYSGGGKFARMIDLDFSVTTNETELYSDNELEEADYSFSNGALKLGVSDLSDGVAADLFGVEQQNVEEEEGVSENLYNESMVSNDVGFGVVIEKVKDSDTKYRAIVLTRVKFKVPGEVATTRGKQITFQTGTIEGVAMRDRSEKRNYKRDATFSTRSAAIAYIKRILKLSDTAAATVTEGETDDGNS